MLVARPMLASTDQPSPAQSGRSSQIQFAPPFEARTLFLPPGLCTISLSRPGLCRRRRPLQSRQSTPPLLPPAPPRRKQKKPHRLTHLNFALTLVLSHLRLHRHEPSPTLAHSGLHQITAAPLPFVGLHQITAAAAPLRRPPPDQRLTKGHQHCQLERLWSRFGILRRANKKAAGKVG